MSFLYPLFLMAGLTVAIPLIIHLFNLRRYKTVYFPSTRFLKNIQLQSQKQSQIRYKWLLALRILFLLSLILAFAQPFFPGNKKAVATNRLQLIYIDNSNSMSVKKGMRSMLDIAKDLARKQLKAAAPEAKFILLTNDKPVSYQAQSPEKILTALNSIDITPATKTSDQVLSTTQGLVQTEAAEGADVYYYSDFQKSGFSASFAGSSFSDIAFWGIPIQAESVSNIFIDTAFLASPSLQAGQDNRLIVKSRFAGDRPKDATIMQLSINGQVKSATDLKFSEQNISIDTLSFQVNNAGWQKLILTINDATVRFDDTFRIAARSATNLSVLVLNEAQINPYLQAAFKAYNGFKMEQHALNEKADWSQYNLVILNGITHFTEQLISQVTAALQKGQSICIFPGKTSDITSLNNGLNKIADIQIQSIDTANQSVSSLQQGSELIRDLFERIPDNVQLPTTNWHYIIKAGLTANQQSILSFRNGDPFLAQYSPGSGKIYLLASPADLSAGNFPGSYFFVPFLYQMTSQARSSDIYSITAGTSQPIFLSQQNKDDRNVVHIYGDDLDIVPPQRPNGTGLEIFVTQLVQHPGFYTLASKANDTAIIALNSDRSESHMETWNLDQLKKNWQGEHINWIDATNMSEIGHVSSGSGFPLWKVCAILALLMLAAESYLLAAGFRKQTVAPR